ncbi:hypothetical protein [Streptomyces sp. NPDC002426]
MEEVVLRLEELLFPSIADVVVLPWPRGHRFADRTRVDHATVHELLTTGLGRRAIGRQLRMISCAVKLLGYAATPAGPVPRVAGPAIQTRRLQALPGRSLEPGLRERLEGVGGDRAARLSGQLSAGARLLPGEVEGHVNRITMLRRQMFGRVGFALFRKRVLFCS